MNMQRSQDTYLRTGRPGQYRVSGERGCWLVEATDSNGVWVLVERFARQVDAKDYAKTQSATND